MSDPSAAEEGSNPAQSLSLSFVLSKQRQGKVFVTVEPNMNAENYGTNVMFPDEPLEYSHGFPACTAIVKSTGGRGYASMYGWVQMVKPPLTGGDVWEMDPIPITSDLNTPFTWFGPEPTLFDLPFQPKTRTVDWVAHSFLTSVQDLLLSKDVRPILGFRWGYDINEGKVKIKQLQELDLNAWDEHLELMRGKFHGWTFHSSTE